MLSVPAANPPVKDRPRLSCSPWRIAREQSDCCS
jgi:hypothetical protein